MHVLLTVYVQEGSGFIAVSTNKLIVYGSYSSAMNPGVCVEAVERVGRFETLMSGGHLLKCY